MTADSEALEVEGVEDAVAHKGILQAARFIMNTLSNMQLLHTAFRRATVGHFDSVFASPLIYIIYAPC